MKYHIVNKVFKSLCGEHTTAAINYGDKIMSQEEYKLIRVKPNMCDKCVTRYEQARKL